MPEKRGIPLTEYIRMTRDQQISRGMENFHERRKERNE
jgi:hypothetical protein